MRLSLIVLLSALCFAASFAAVLYLGPLAPPVRPTVVRNIEFGSIDAAERFDDPTVMSAALTDGWGKQEPWGVWMAGREATIAPETTVRARDDIQLILEGRGPAPGRRPRRLQVLVNDSSVGEFDLAASRGDVAQRLVVDKDVFNRRWPPAIRLRLDGDEPEGFGVRRISMRDASQIRLTRGFVDGCEEGRVYGWASADNLPVPVIISANGERLTGRLKSIERPDLARLSISSSAGFELEFAKPLPKGTEVHVVFPGGRPLDQSPCRI
jgi:hypothetical protein